MGRSSHLSRARASQGQGAVGSGKGPGRGVKASTGGDHGL